MWLFNQLPVSPLVSELHENLDCVFFCSLLNIESLTQHLAYVRCLLRQVYGKRELVGLRSWLRIYSTTAVCSLLTILIDWYWLSRLWHHGFGGGIWHQWGKGMLIESQCCGSGYSIFVDLGLWSQEQVPFASYFQHKRVYCTIHR